MLIYGHTHVPVVRRLGGTLVINPGSVGEGRPEPRGFVRSCAVLDTATGEARIIDLD
ncbi:metallophosphoesterase family protein [Novosphingobium resinovorum]